MTEGIGIYGGIVITKRGPKSTIFFQDIVFDHRDINLFIEPWHGFPNGDSYWMILE